MREGIGQPFNIDHTMWVECGTGWPIPSLISCVLCVINVEPVDLFLPSFPVFYVWSMDGRDRSTGSTLTTYKTQYRNEGSDRSTGSTLITHKTTYSFPHFLCFMCNQCWKGWPIPSLISCVLCVINVEPLTYPFPHFYSQKTQEMREGIRQPIQHWSHIKYKKWGKW
jgi:hypothetical protein